MGIALAAGGVLSAGSACGQIGDTVEKLAIVSAGLTRPIDVVQPVGDGRLFIVEQRSGSTGRIRVYKNGMFLTPPFFSVTGLATGSEQGLLGLAFHPGFLTNGWFWINYTNSSGTTIIERVRVVDPAADVAVVAERQIIFTLAQPFTNHNGGWLAFGPDGYMYSAQGDGGSGGDPGNRAQDRTVLLGKMLRLDVDGPDNIPGNTDDDEFPAVANKLYAIPPSNPYVGNTAGYLTEIWSFGLRNPWRPGFDKLTGDLWIADVGQGLWEEINVQPGSSTGGENYGWRVREGLSAYSNSMVSYPPFVDPLFDYSHDDVDYGPVFRIGCSVTGGFVYRGCAMPQLQGYYLFADYCQGWIGAYNPADGTVEILTPSIPAISSFGQDNDGEIYVVSQGSPASVFKLVPKVLVDCNSNGRADSCDISSGFSQDLNNNGVPDECGPCIADIDGVPGVDLNDFFYFFNCFDATQPCADIDGVPGVDLNDYFLFLTAFDSGCE